MITKQICRTLFVVPLILFAAGPADATVVIDRVEVGDPGNAANSGGTLHNGYGAVGYTFYIGKYNVTNAQYVEFLNAVDPTGANALALYRSEMSNSLGGIDLTLANAIGSRYSTKTNMENKPVNNVSQIDAFRFVNWYANGQGTGSTETGPYTLTGGGVTPTTSGVRNGGAQYFIPTRDEIFKASYYDPVDSGADAVGFHGANYWDYATQSNTLPTIGSGNATGDVSSPGANVVNYNANTWGVGARVTTVGTAGNTSHYGAYDLSGGVHNWIEDSGSGVSTGSAASSDQHHLEAGWYESGWGRSQDDRDGRFGFRIASLIASDEVSTVPEPSTYALGLIGLAGLGLVAWRRRRASRS